MDRLEAMSIFVAAIDAGSLSGAGRKLGAPLPTVSRKLADLEAHLGARLLVRSTRKLTLTEAGAAYLAASKRILEQVGEAERAVAGEYAAPRGELVVTAPIVFGRLHVLPIVNDFLARYPDIDVRLALSDRNADLIDDHIDVAVRIGRLPESAAVATRVGSVRRVVCASPAYLERRGEPKTPSDLSTHDCVTFEGLGEADAWDFPAPGSRTERVSSIRSRLSVSTAEAAIDAASASVGVTRVLSYQAVGAIEAGALRVILKDFEGEALPVHILHAGQGLLPLKTRAFLDAAAPRLRRALRAPPAA